MASRVLSSNFRLGNTEKLWFDSSHIIKKSLKLKLFLPVFFYYFFYYQSFFVLQFFLYRHFVSWQFDFFLLRALRKFYFFKTRLVRSSTRYIFRRFSLHKRRKPSSPFLKVLYKRGSGAYSFDAHKVRILARILRRRSHYFKKRRLLLCYFLSAFRRLKIFHRPQQTISILQNLNTIFFSNFFFKFRRLDSIKDYLKSLRSFSKIFSLSHTRKNSSTNQSKNILKHTWPTTRPFTKLFFTASFFKLFNCANLQLLSNKNYISSTFRKHKEVLNFFFYRFCFRKTIRRKIFFFRQFKKINNAVSGKFVLKKASLSANFTRRKVAVVGEETRTKLKVRSNHNNYSKCFSIIIKKNFKPYVVLSRRLCNRFLKNRLKCFYSSFSSKRIQLLFLKLRRTSSVRSKKRYGLRHCWPAPPQFGRGLRLWKVLDSFKNPFRLKRLFNYKSLAYKYIAGQYYIKWFNLQKLKNRTFSKFLHTFYYLGRRRFRFFPFQKITKFKVRAYDKFTFLWMLNQPKWWRDGCFFRFRKKKRVKFNWLFSRIFLYYSTHSDFNPFISNNFQGSFSLRKRRNKFFFLPTRFKIIFLLQFLPLIKKKYFFTKFSNFGVDSTLPTGLKFFFSSKFTFKPSFRFKTLLLKQQIGQEDVLRRPLHFNSIFLLGIVDKSGSKFVDTAPRLRVLNFCLKQLFFSVFILRSRVYKLQKFYLNKKFFFFFFKSAFVSFFETY